MREFERFHEIRLRNFVSRAFNHDDVVFGSDINQIEIALDTLIMRWVGNELTVDASDAHRTDRTCERNIRNTKRGRCAIDCKNVGVILTIGTKQDRDDLGVVKISLRK